MSEFLKYFFKDFDKGVKKVLIEFFTPLAIGIAVTFSIYLLMKLPIAATILTPFGLKQIPYYFGSAAILIYYTREFYKDHFSKSEKQ